MYFLIKVEDFKKISFTDFCKKNNYDQDMIVKGSDILIRIKSDEAELEIKVTEGKGKNNSFEESTAEEIFSPLFSSIECLMKNEKELVLALELSRYIASCTNMVLYDGFEKYITGEKINNMSEEVIKQWTEESKILLKYYYKIRSIKEKRDSINMNTFTTPYVISLVFFSIVSALLLIYMILGLKITNAILLALPPLIAIGIHLVIPIKKIITLDLLNKKLWQTAYERIIDISNLYNMKIPKKPSVTKKQENKKQLMINIIGISILPAIIIGSILMAIDHIIIGIIVCALPWIILIMIKVLVTDKETNNLEKVILELTEELWKKVDEYVGIKYEIIEKTHYNWTIQIGIYKQIDVNTLNDLDTENEMIEIKELSRKIRCNCRWEEVEDRIASTILQKIVTTEDFKKREQIKVITVGFIDGRERIVFLKDDPEE